MQSTPEFDQFARDYRDIHNANIRFTGGSSDYYAEYKVKLLADLSRGVPIENILDLGCGDGLSDFFFRSYFPNAKIDGIDPSGESIEQARQRAIPACEYTVYDGSSIPFAEKSFDIVFLSCILHHVPANQHLSLLGECFRVLRPGGRIFIFEHNPLNPLTRKIVRDCPFDVDAILIPALRLQHLMGKLPFTEARTRYTLFFPRHRLFNWMLGLERWMGWFPLGGQYTIYARRK